MKKAFLVIPVLVAGGFALFAQLGPGQSEGQAASEPRVISALGVAQVQGQDAYVHITVLVPSGQDEHAAARAALARYGARPFESAGLDSGGYTYTDLFWDALPVIQNYNGRGEPSGVNGLAALQGTHTMWTEVETSSFGIEYGGPTRRCPSLVDECPGVQRFDGNNDVAFLGLSGPCDESSGCTLGVAWWGTTVDEADIALNTKANWYDTCGEPPQGWSFDVQTVMGHENGHVAGLGHSGNPDALMYAYYNGAQCSLHQDDIDGLSSLYPVGEPTPTPEPGKCPPGWQKKGWCEG